MTGKGTKERVNGWTPYPVLLGGKARGSGTRSESLSQKPGDRPWTKPPPPPSQSTLGWGGGVHRQASRMAPAAAQPQQLRQGASGAADTWRGFPRCPAQRCEPKPPAGSVLEGLESGRPPSGLKVGGLATHGRPVAPRRPPVSSIWRGSQACPAGHWSLPAGTVRGPLILDLHGLPLHCFLARP